MSPDAYAAQRQEDEIQNICRIAKTGLSANGHGGTNMAHREKPGVALPRSHDSTKMRCVRMIGRWKAGNAFKNPVHVLTGHGGTTGPTV